MGNIGRRNPAVPDDWEAVPVGGRRGVWTLVDQGDVIMSHENNAAILAAISEARYGAILAALSRIEKKTYGKCESVRRSDIGEARLEADPAADDLRHTFAVMDSIDSPQVKTSTALPKGNGSESCAS